MGTQERNINILLEMSWYFVGLSYTVLALVMNSPVP